MVARSISLPTSSSISRGIAVYSSQAFDPLSLFAAGEQGVWYDPSDMATLFQDSAGTIPVTAAGQPVGKMLDKSGRGNHATQATATSRPILQTSGGKWYLVFDGVDDGMATAAINFTASNKMTAWCGLLKAAEPAGATVFEISADTSANNGTFCIFAPSNVSGADYLPLTRGTIAVSNRRQGFPAPHTAVLCMQSSIAAPSIGIRVNTTTAADDTRSQGTGNYGTWPLYLGRRGGVSNPFTGRIYGLIVRVVASDLATVTQTETWMNGKTGAY